MDIKVIFKKTFLFKELSGQELTAINKFCKTEKLKKNDILFTEGQSAECFFIIVEGKLKVYKSSSDGKEQTIHIQSDGDLVAEAAIFDREIYPASCMAIKNSSVAKIQKHEFLNFLTENPKIMFKLLSSYSKRMRQLVSLIEDLSLSDIRKRFIKYLIENSKRIGNKDCCSLNISKKELASFLGTTPESLSRTIFSLKNEGVIEMTDEKNFFYDASKLIKMNQ